jgi:hypothetical protein
MFAMAARASWIVPAKVRRPVAQQRRVGGLNRRIGAGPHGHPNMGGGQREGIVDPITHHHHAAMRRHLADRGDLVLWHQLSAVIHPEGLRYRCGGAGVVAGQHHALIKSANAPMSLSPPPGNTLFSSIAPITLRNASALLARASAVPSATSRA